MSEESTSGCGCGCILWVIILVFVFWAFVFGLVTPWGKFNFDLFPPQIREVSTEEAA